MVQHNHHQLARCLAGMESSSNRLPDMTFGAVFLRLMSAIAFLQKWRLRNTDLKLGYRIAFCSAGQFRSEDVRLVIAVLNGVRPGNWNRLRMELCKLHLLRVPCGG